jgi:cytochrome P450
MDYSLELVPYSLRANSALLLLAPLATYLILSKKKLIRSNENSKSNSNNAPPMAPMGLFKTIKSMIGNGAPWFILNTARELKSYVYRLKLHTITGCPMYVIIGEHKLARKVLMDPLSTKPEKMYSSMDGITSGVPAMFTSNGEYWHSRRKGVAPAFSPKHVRRMNNVASDKAEEWIKTKLTAFVEKGQSFDVGKEMIDITLSTISEAAFEYCISDEEKKMFLKESELCMREFANKTSIYPLRESFGFLIQEHRRACAAAKYVKSLALNIIHAYRKLENPTKDTIIDRIMNNKAYQNDDERAADIISLFIAGHDTTAYTIAWILKELAQNPKEQQKLRDSLHANQMEDWSKSDALRKIVKEGMRLYPVAALGSGRCVGRDIESEDGLFVIPKGSFVLVPMILLFRNEHVFHDADSFLPSRWDDDQVTTEMKDGHMPFSLGKQNCVGQSLANAEIHTLIPQIFANFELELEEEGIMEYFITMKPIKTMIKAKKILG